jgi:hypothetical protein
MRRTSVKGLANSYVPQDRELQVQFLTSSFTIQA